MEQSGAFAGGGSGAGGISFDEAAGAFAFGLKRAPYDEFPALLHQGEQVLTMGRGVLPGGAALGTDKGHSPGGPFAISLNAMPYDRFPALPRQGERAAPPAEARNGGDTNVTVRVDSIVVEGGDGDTADAIAATLAQKLREAVLRGGG